LEAAVVDLRAHLAGGRRVIVVQPGHGLVERTVEVLGEHDVPARALERIDARADGAVVEVVQAALEHGLVLADPALVVLTGEDLSGQRASTRDMRKMPTRRKKQIDPLELKPGDY